MLGSWWFGGGNSPDSNYLRVANAAFPNRRLSDNTLMTPKIRIAPSCASSPGKFVISFEISQNPQGSFFSFKGGTPGGGLPIRRHSSIGPQGKHFISNFNNPKKITLVFISRTKSFRYELIATHGKSPTFFSIFNVVTINNAFSSSDILEKAVNFVK
jgi:hypothetical protein